MAKKRVADQLVDVLAEAGVRRICGVSGDSRNGITDSIRASRKLDWIHLRHEETAAFAAGAEAHLTGRWAVCAGSCGPGNLHLIQRTLRLSPQPGARPCHRGADSRAMKSEADTSRRPIRNIFSHSAATIAG